MGTIDIIISMMGTRLWKITDEPMYVFWRYVTSCSWWINLQINSTHWKVIVRQIIRIIQPRWCRLVSHCLMATKSIKRNVDTRIQLSGLQSLFWRKQTVSVAAHTYIYLYLRRSVRQGRRQSSFCRGKETSLFSPYWFRSFLLGWLFPTMKHTK